MPNLGVEIADLLDPESAVDLRAWAETNAITLTYAGWVERGNTAAKLISAYAHELGEHNRKLVLKVAPKGWNDTPEPRAHRAALAASAPSFRDRHLVELPWPAIALTTGGWIMFQEIASGSLDDIHPLSTILDDPTQTDAATQACAVIVGSMLAEWNPTPRRMDPFPTAGELLRTLLGGRLNPGGTVRQWAEANGVLVNGRPAGEPPNPFALVLDDLLTESGKLYVRIGNSHGDPHPGNILIPRDPADYRLIDLSRFAKNRPLAFDPAYLALTIAARCLPRLPPPERDALAELLVDPGGGRAADVPDGPRAILTAIMDTARVWGAHNGLGDEWRREMLLCVLGGALIMTGRSIIPDSHRNWFYHLARRAAASYLGLPMPAESPDANPWKPDGAYPVETTVLPAGTRLWRVHPREAPADEFVAEPSGRRSVLYASRRKIIAILEKLLYGDRLQFHNGERELSLDRLRGMRLSGLRTTRDLELACADGEPDLAVLWPLEAVHGIEWQSRHDLPEPTLVLLEDRVPDGSLQPNLEDALDLDDPKLLGWLRESLRPYQVRLARYSRSS